MRARRPTPWLRRPLGWAAPALFATQFVVLDVAMRAQDYRTGAGPFAAAAASVAIGLLLHSCATRRLVRAPLAVLAGVALVAQAVCFVYYRAPLDVQVAASALHAWADVRRAVAPNLPRVALLVAIATVVEFALLSTRARVRGTRPRLALGLVAIAGLALGPPLARATPELRLADAARALLRPREAPLRGAIRLPQLPSGRRALPSVLLVVTESVRATDYCTAPSSDCATSPAVNALLPDRVPLEQMRAISSYTAIAIGALMTGRTQQASREALAQTPNVLDWARAVRHDGARPRAIYWSSQSESIFERDEPRAMADDFVTLETLTGKTYAEDPVDTGFDRLLAAHTRERLPALGAAPYLLVLHFFSTHAPYFVDPADAPFQPWAQVVSWSGMPTLYNAYKNSIRAQDKLVAGAVRAFIAGQGGRPWIVLFTSDHGEAFGEHGAIHHGQNLYDEQLHVPAWIAFGNGALSDEQAANLRTWSRAYVTHLDLVPTLLDAWGVLDSLPMANLRPALEGRSLLRPFEPMRRALPITNCTEMFPCPVNAWGMMRDRWELHAQVWDPEWRCADLGGGAATGGEAECARLREESRTYFAVMPNRRPNR